MTYRVFSRRTGTCLAKCKTIKGARRARNRLDLEYGANIHYIMATSHDGQMSQCVG
jgi:hypothetical protein